MRKTFVIAIAAGLLALTGVALADQAVLVDGNLHTPAGDVPVDQSTGGLPLPGLGAVPVSDQVAQANDALSQNGVPAQVRMQDSGVRPDIKCSGLQPVNQPLNGALNPACTQEPTVPYPNGAGIASLGPQGVQPSQWVTVDSGQVFTYVPSAVKGQIPADQQKALEQANQQVNAKAEAQLTDDANTHGGFPGFFDGSAFQQLKDTVGHTAGGVASVPLPVGDGKDAKALGDGVDQLWQTDVPGLSGNAPGQDSQLPAESANLGPAKGPDLGTMAAAAAVLGGAVFAPLALYHRIRSNNTLNNKTRQMVYDAVVKTPGIGVNDAAKAANCSYSTAAYHLERLVEERLLVCSEDGRRARYFKNGGAFSQAEREFVPILQSQEAMNVLQVIVENPWCYRAEVAQKLGVSGPTVNWHLKKLMNVGAVKEMREGRVSYLYADKKVLTNLGANLIGKLPDDLVQRLRFENRPAPEFVEPAVHLPETGVPELGVGEELELAPLPEASTA